MRLSQYILTVITVISVVALFFLLACPSNQPEAEAVIVWRGHEGAVTDLAFSLDSKWLATGGADRTVRIWETASGKLIQTFKGHRMSVTAVEFSSDGQWIASSSLDRTICLWPVD